MTVDISERVEIRLFEREREAGEAERVVDVHGAIRVCEGIFDRMAHGGFSDVGQQRAIDQADHRMDERLGMNDDIDVVDIEIEQQRGLDHLEALVRKRG